MDIPACLGSINAIELTMNEHRIAFPGWMERCIGFTIPEDGKFFAFYFDEWLAHFDIRRGQAIEIDDEWSFCNHDKTLTVDGQTQAYIGLNGGTPLLTRETLGKLSLTNSCVQLAAPNGRLADWQFDNFSGDWEFATFDKSASAFLYGVPYDFDFRYIELS